MFKPDNISLTTAAKHIKEYKNTGKIGNTKPRDLEHAIKIARAIAKREVPILGRKIR